MACKRLVSIHRKSPHCVVVELYTVQGRVLAEISAVNLKGAEYTSPYGRGDAIKRMNFDCDGVKIELASGKFYEIKTDADTLNIRYVQTRKEPLNQARLPL